MRNIFHLISIRTVSWWLIKRLISLQFPEIEQLSTADLATWLADTERLQPLLLDARTLEEYQVSHLDDAKLIPEEANNLIETIDRTTPIVVYCSVGYRSSAIARRLKSWGYENVFNLSGSIFQWANENRPVYRQGQTVTEVHPYSKFWQYLLVDHT
ncbi:MAG: rhodanese-like domain-containing protein [Cyanobacteria bacterium J06600_6]